LKIASKDEDEGWLIPRSDEIWVTKEELIWLGLREIDPGMPRRW
jgi:hypothetical protein